MSKNSSKTNKTITLWQAHGRQGVGNRPDGFIKMCTVEPGDVKQLAEAVLFDNCLASYQGGYRTGKDFIRSNVIMVDVDNSFSDNSEDWIHPADVVKALDGVMLYQYPSRNHMKPKDGKAPRPKFHTLLPIEPTEDATVFTRYMSTMIERFPRLHFDEKVKSPAQLNFGVENVEITFIDGKKNLTDFLKDPDRGPDVTQSSDIVPARSYIDPPGNLPPARAEGIQPLSGVSGDDAKPSAVSADTKGVAPPASREGVISEGQGRECYIYDLAYRTMYATNSRERTVEVCAAANTEKCSPPLDEREFHHAVFATGIARAEKDIANDPGYIDSENSDFSLKPADLTDVGEALILAREYGDRLRHSAATNYLVYSGQVWEEKAARARGMLHELTEKQLEENTPAYHAANKALEKAEQELLSAKQNGSDADKRKAIAAHAKAKKNHAPIAAYQAFILKRRNSKEISGVMKEAQTPLEINVSELDANSLLLNTPGGEVDLRTGEIHPHNPESFHTKITAVAPSSEGTDIWQDFLDFITCKRPALENYLQLTSGAELVGHVYMEMLIIAHGNGKNGKSTFYNTKSRVLGDYAGQISAETLTTGRKNGKNWELAELRGKRLIVAPELEEGTRLDAAFVKKICSTDKILGEQKYKTPFAFEPSHTTVLYTNHLPRIGSSDAGTWRRIIVVPFDAVIERKSDIKNYADHLFRNAGGAALSWAIKGARRFIEAGFHIDQPDCVAEAIERYREQNDWLSNFLGECCEIDKKYREKSGELYRHYREYCVKNGDYIRSSVDFKAAVENAGYETQRTKTGVIVHGLRVEREFLR
jgi:P4 family phage/plasmid primase-like protien